MKFGLLKTSLILFPENFDRDLIDIPAIYSRIFPLKSFRLTYYQLYTITTKHAEHFHFFVGYFMHLGHPRIKVDSLEDERVSLRAFVISIKFILLNFDILLDNLLLSRMCLSL